MEIEWQDLHHGELSAARLYQLLALRSQVFVVEQQCVYQDIDGADLQGSNRHLLGLYEDRLLAYARILAPQAAGEPVKIGRVIVSDEARGLSLGSRLIAQAIASCERHWPQQPQFLSAQAHLQRFYSSAGFVAEGEVYDEDGIPHIDMRRGK